MENLILEKLTKRGGKTEFMTLRHDLPITTEYPLAYKNLKKANLINEETKAGKTIVSITENGQEAYINGIEKWAKKKVYEDIKNRNFSITKDLSQIEMKGVRDLEDEGYVYEYLRNKYKINPNKNIFLSTENNIKQNTDKSKKTRNRNWISIFNSFGWWILLILGFFAIIEYQYHYVVSGWEWILNLF